MIGLEPTWDEHLDNLMQVFDEVWRVMRDDATLWLNYGDAYWGGKGASSSTKEAYNRRESETLNKSYQHVNKFGNTRPLDRRDQIWKPKDLVMMPARIAIAMQERGWVLRSEIVWAKRNSMPESVINRPTSAHEKIFLFAKSNAPKYWTHPLTYLHPEGVRQKPEPDVWYQLKETGALVKDKPKKFKKKKVRKKWKVINWRGHDYFYDHVAVRTERTPDSIARDYRAFGGKPEVPPGQPPHSGDLFQPRENRNKTWSEDAPKSAKSLSRPDRQKKQDGHGTRHAGFNARYNDANHPTANLRNVWHLATESFKGAHFATFPTKLVEPCIKAGTSEHGVCTECGAPHSRISDTKAAASYKEPEHRKRRPTGEIAGIRDRTRDYVNIKTTGWQPTCECKGDKQPAVILDPFGGAGTVSVVAERLGRDSIICEVSAEYAEIARKRIEGESLPMFPTKIEVI